MGCQKLLMVSGNLWTLTGGPEMEPATSENAVREMMVAAGRRADCIGGLQVRVVGVGKGTGTFIPADGKSGSQIFPKPETECVMIPTDDLQDGLHLKIRSAVRSDAEVCALQGLGGADGNLSAGQIVEQVWRLAAAPGVERISNVELSWAWAKRSRISKT